MTRNPSIDQIKLIDVLNLQNGARLICEEGIVERDSKGYSVGVRNEVSFDCFNRSDNAASALKTLNNISSGTSLKYYCDSERLYLGTVGFQVDRKEGETLEQAVSRVSDRNDLTFVEMGEEQQNLFNSYYPVLVTRSSFEHVLNELRKEEGRGVLKEFSDKAIFDSSDKLTQPWSYFPEGTRKHSICEWIVNRYQLDKEESLLENEFRAESTGASQC